MEVKDVKVLVVDDDKEVQDALRNTIIDLGYSSENIETTWNGGAAISACRRASLEGVPFDLVMSDYQMPYMSGVEFLNEILTWDESTKPKHVMMISGTSESELRGSLPTRVKILSKASLASIRDHILSLEF
jgi:CheY-like chemotaxis protein